MFTIKICEYIMHLILWKLFLFIVICLCNELVIYVQHLREKFFYECKCKRTLKQ